MQDPFITNPYVKQQAHSCWENKKKSEIDIVIGKHSQLRSLENKKLKQKSRKQIIFMKKENQNSFIKKKKKVKVILNHKENSQS